ncbi:hypothetical protein GCM10011487_16020 [Steroidobacter agaridevorans]|uniref:Uncharacterized protein n=1 Tax=Steroidobacter agaridevorans TaxID=2695856 RepID=A0A829YAD8_9GAMM|nr:hypothetical protein [Steroidobacter agaridevorans]GFE79602.1 hypothetical protein GCM10011487_16020 [Steroidobacter agaridevorans]GFE88607.1 hypothetical protein GCM10011488_35610 [Steroidobacter agaridevorans]
MHRGIRNILLIALLQLATPAQAAWVTYNGKVEQILTYPGGTYFYVILDAQPASPGNSTCNPALFAVDGPGANKTLSIVELAAATERSLAITIDDAATCVGGYLPVVRVTFIN